MIPSPDQIDIELAKRELLDFTLQTKKNFRTNWHHKRICKKLDDFADGKIPRLMIFMPPRHGKSELASRRLPAYLLGKNPDKQVISSSYSSGLAEKMNRDVQRIIESPEYAKIFPNVKLPRPGDRSRVRNNSEFELVNYSGAYRCAGVGGPITGTGGDFIIVDDPIKNMEEANSKTIRDKVWDWYTSTLYTRLEGEIAEDEQESESEGSIAIILTRWHEDDLAGRLLEKAKNDPNADQWEIVEFPAIREDMNNDDDPREIGQALWPQKYPVKRLKKIKASVGSKVWTSLYQQKPTPGDSAIFKREDIRFYKTLPQGRPTLKLISADLTFKDNDSADFVVFGCYALYGADVYLIDQDRDRMDFTASLKRFAAFCKKHPDATVKLVEDKANGPALISVLSKKIPGIIAVEPKGGKVARANAVSPFFESGNVYYPHESVAPWIGDHINEMVFFPFSKNDDRVDSETQALARFFIGRADEWTDDDEEDYNEDDELIETMEW